MIYLKTTEGQHIVVLEPGNLIDLKAGEVIVSPHKDIMIAYTPDILFFSKKIQRVVEDQDLTSNEDLGFAEKFDAIHKESLSRTEVVERPYHELKQVKIKKD